MTLELIWTDLFIPTQPKFPHQTSLDEPLRNKFGAHFMMYEREMCTKC